MPITFAVYANTPEDMRQEIVASLSRRASTFERAAKAATSARGRFANKTAADAFRSEANLWAQMVIAASSAAE